MLYGLLHEFQYGPSKNAIAYTVSSAKRPLD